MSCNYLFLKIQKWLENYRISNTASGLDIILRSVSDDWTQASFFYFEL